MNDCTVENQYDMIDNHEDIDSMESNCDKNTDVGPYVVHLTKFSKPDEEDNINEISDLAIGNRITFKEV